MTPQFIGRRLAEQRASALACRLADQRASERAARLRKAIGRELDLYEWHAIWSEEYDKEQAASRGYPWGHTILIGSVSAVWLSIAMLLAWWFFR